MTSSRFAHLLRPELGSIEAYAPPLGSFEVRLDANESPAMLSPHAHAELAKALIPDVFARYPDARSTQLREAIAARAGVKASEVHAGCGSDEVLASLLSALDRPRDKNAHARIVTTTPTFVMYKLSAKARGIETVEVPLDATWNLDVSGMKRAVEFARPNIIFIATPNNPTSSVMTESRIRSVIESAQDALVVIDEAYADFAATRASHLFREYPNVALLGTLSKIGFAALRVGWLIGPSELVQELDKVRQPYNIPVPSQRGATFVLRSLQDEIDRLVKHVVDERERMTRELDAIGFSVTPSQANFLWVETKRPATEVFDGLSSNGILVRCFAKSGGRLAKRLRITVGTQTENDRLLETIARFA